MNTLTEIIREIQDAVKLAEVTTNKPEGKLRELVSPIWERFLKEKRIGLNLQIREELTLANGRADTVFNKLILEYKKPHSIKPDNNKNRKFISQVQGYILDLAQKERFSKDRLLGVAFDGSHFLFMRYIKRWINEEPVPVNESSLELFLKNLEKLTSKAALIPENLIRDFAVGRESHNKVAVDCIKSFYNEINLHGDKGDTKEHWFFEQWKVQFAEVHGSLEQKKIDKETLFTSYGFSKKEQKDFNVLAFFFSLDSYFALLMKLLSYQVVGFYTLKDLAGLPLHDWETYSSDDLRKKCGELEEGGIFRNLGIRNFLEGDLFSWYIQAWNDKIYAAIKQIINHLNDYDPETMEVAPDETRDILKKLYQYLVPKQIRHDLGEYYTPDWLAERCLNQLNYNGDPKYRILDPGCGSGTFPILAIKRAKEYASKHNINPTETLNNILKNIYGFDLNPLAVTAARTNYMLAIAELLKHKSGEITIPIYLCDSINPPRARIANEMTLFPEKVPYEVKTAVGDFLFSHCMVVTKKRVQQFATIMEDRINAGETKEAVLKKLKTQLELTDEEFEESELYMEETYEKLMELKNRGVNGIWARIIKNAFAPLFVDRFDMVVGNPPWVNWESLPEEYRAVLLPINHNIYNLFLHKGLAARHGAAKIDISTLMLYVSADRYLKDSGKLCFVITQTLFKTAGGAKGFRQFLIKPTKTPLRVEQVDDMVELQPFEGATNRTALISIKKGQKTEYPLPYLLWRKSQPGRIPMDSTYDEVFSLTKRLQLYAKPIDKSDAFSSWITARKKALASLDKIVNISQYVAHEGSNTGGANGVYWVRIEKVVGNNLLVSNAADIGKKKIAPVTMEIEPEFVFPLLRGRDISKWGVCPNYSLIVPQLPKDRSKGYPEAELSLRYPKTYAYLKNFEENLKDRVIFKYLAGQPFYSLYDIKNYTFAPHKVVWSEVSQDIRAAVAGSYKDIHLGEKIIIPDHTVVAISFDKEREAHFACALLNSTPSQFIVKGYVVLHPSPHILNHIAIPHFDSSNDIHQNLSHLSSDCHGKIACGIGVTDLEEQIDELATKIWGLTREELKDIKDSLEELS